jgi:hypothetical protein
MAYKGKVYTSFLGSAYHQIEIIRDFLLACGWKLVGPTATAAMRTAQDDLHGHILGWYLHSNGEDGTKDLHLHMGVQEDSASPMSCPSYSYLSANIDDTVTTIPVNDSSVFAATGRVKIGGELITYTGAAANELTGCTREADGSTKAAHFSREVVVQCGFFKPYFDLYSYRDLIHSIAESDDALGVTWVLGIATTTGAVTGLDGYKSGAFKYGALLRVLEGDHAGKVRPIWADVAGDLSYAPFFSAPGPVNCDIVSQGFLPCVSRRDERAGANWAHHTSAPKVGFDGDGSTALLCVGSKDGFLLGSQIGESDYYNFVYYGTYISNGSPVLDAISSHTVPGGNIPAAATIVHVEDTTKYVVGRKYRILAQDYQDWIDNWDRSADTTMGATPGDWPDLDVDEIPTELVLVDSIDAVNSEITFRTPLIYSYRAYAVIAEDPQPIISYCDTGSVLSGDLINSSGYAIQNPFFAVATYYLASCPHHRVRWRCCFLDLGNTEDPWGPVGAPNYILCTECARQTMNPGEHMNDGLDGYTDSWPLALYTVEGVGDDTGINSIARLLGYLPIIRKCQYDFEEFEDERGEDYGYIMWNRQAALFEWVQHETFGYHVVGPMLWS